MNKDEFIRFWLHFPVGLLIAGLICAGLFYSELMVYGLVGGVLLGFTFLVYEVINDWRKVDWSYKDVFGEVFGLGTGLVICLGFHFF